MPISKRSLLVLIVIGAAGAATGEAGAALAPLPVTGWNQDVVIENSGPGGGQNNTADISATMDAGTAKTGGTWYENGLAGSGGGGLPTAGTLLTSAFDPNTTFTLQSYTANNALLGGGTLTLTTPTKLTSLALFGSTGSSGGTKTDTAVIHFSDGTADYTAPTLNDVGQDWFNGNQTALNANGRMNNVVTGTYDNVNAGNPRLYQDTIDLSAYSTHPVSGVTITYNGTGQNVIMAISGQTAPEPASVGLLALGSLSLLARRRRTA